MPKKSPNCLTPAQAADVIRYYDASDNAGYHEQGWAKRKVPLGRLALRLATSKHSILPDKMPMLTLEEATKGLEHLEAPSWPVEPTDDELDQMERLVDTIPTSYDDAYYRVMGIKPYNWK